MTGIGRCFCVQISQISESDQSLCGFWAKSTLLPLVTSYSLYLDNFGLCQKCEKSTSHS